MHRDKPLGILRPLREFALIIRQFFDGIPSDKQFPHFSLTKRWHDGDETIWRRQLFKHAIWWKRVVARCKELLRRYSDTSGRFQPRVGSVDLPAQRRVGRRARSVRPVEEAASRPPAIGQNDQHASQHALPESQRRLHDVRSSAAVGARSRNCRNSTFLKPPALAINLASSVFPVPMLPWRASQVTARNRATSSRVTSVRDDDRVSSGGKSISSAATSSIRCRSICCCAASKLVI